MLSYWEKESFLYYDLIVVGGGLVGLSTAASWLEKKPKSKVLVIERGIFPSGASTKNAGFACFGSLSELLADQKAIGEEKMLGTVEKRWKGLRFLLKRLGKSALDYKNYGGYELLLSSKPSLGEDIERINLALHPIFHQPVFKEVSYKIARFGFSKTKVHHLVFNPLEGQLDMGKSMWALQNYVQKKGGRIFTGCEADFVEDHQNLVSVLVKNQSAAQSLSFRAAKVAICTNAFTQKFYPQLEIQPGRGQVLITQPIPKLKIRGTFHFEEGFYYFRNVGERLLLGGGRNRDLAGESTLKFGNTDKIIRDLTKKIKEIILPQQNFVIDQYWSGIMAFSQDRQPIVQKMSANVAVGARLNGMGVAIGSLVAEELVDLLK